MVLCFRHFQCCAGVAAFVFFVAAVDAERGLNPYVFTIRKLGIAVRATVRLCALRFACRFSCLSWALSHVKSVDMFECRCQVPHDVGNFQFQTADGVFE